LVMGILVFGGLFSVFTIPKESSPEIDFGIISVTTIYQGVNPGDIDNLVTEKIEKKIKDIEGIKKISSTSAIGFSSVVVEFQNNADMIQALVDVKDAVDKVDLPSDAEDPSVTSLSTENELMFVALLYGDEKEYSKFYLTEKARTIRSNLESKWPISSIDIGGSIEGGGNVKLWSQGNSNYEIQIMIDKAKLESLGLSLFQVSQMVKSWNKNQPLGNHTIDELSYDFRINGELASTAELEMVPIQTRDGFVYLKNIASIEKQLKDDSLNKMGTYELSGQNYVTIMFNKKAWSSIFASAAAAKELLEEELQKTNYDGLSSIYTTDMSELIKEDYVGLSKNWLQTLILVFICLLVFVGLKESIIATITIPLAFFVTFIVLNWLGLSLNFLTNFSFIITFGIAIDTTIVIIEGAHERIRQWYSAKHAILLAVRDYRLPLIAGTSTTVVVFLPLLTLPGIMGKFLAYIPITIFATLIAALLISLTINSALYYKLSSKRKKYYENWVQQDYLDEVDKTLLNYDRIWLEEKPVHKKSLREKMLDNISRSYSNLLEKIMKSRKSRLAAIIVPFLLFFVSMFVLAPTIGFKLFPDNDNGYMNAYVTAKKGTTTEKMSTYSKEIDEVLTQIPELKVYNYSVHNNRISVSIELLPVDERKAQNLRDIFAIETAVDDSFDTLRGLGPRVEVAAMRDGPPSEGEIWIKLVADTNDKFGTLIEVARDFEEFLLSVQWTRNVAISSQESPWQFVYEFDKSKLAVLWLSPNDFALELFAITNGLNAGTLKGKYDNHDIVLQYKDYTSRIAPSDINALTINTSKWPVNIWGVSDYQFEDAISSISREDTQIIVSVGADLEQDITITTVQPQIDEFIANYQFPDGITSKKWWENVENAELIQAVMVAFVISLLFIFGILVLMFNSYSQPLIIMCSVLMGLLGANIGLAVTGNPYSMMFGIGFIALTWIVVNDAIVFIDRANKNVAKGMPRLQAITEAGHARLHPIILTTITTILWLSSIVKDPFREWLAITIMFGIFFGSGMTLFVIPAVYYSQDKFKKFLKRMFITIGVLAVVGGIVMVIMSLF